MNYIVGQGTCIISECTISGNIATGRGGGIYNYYSTTDISYSTLYDNSASSGAGLFNFYGTANVTNSTISGNSASGDGGGIYNDNSLTVTDCTISGNSGSTGGGLGGGGTLQGTIVANSSTHGGDLSGSFTGSYNLIDQTTSDLSGSSNIINSPADLASLNNYGGPTETMALLPDSPAIGHGSDFNGPGDIPITTDQRGFPLDSPTPDIGAFQTQPTATLGYYTFTVNTSTDGPVQAGQLSLRDAIRLADAYANSTSDTETIAFSSVSGSINLTLGALAIDNTAGEVTIQGPGSNVLTINGGNDSADFTVAAGSKASISGLTITGGKNLYTDSFVYGYGGGIENNGNLTISNSIITGNTAIWGGGIHSAGSGSYLNISSSTISDNSGGGILTYGTAIVSDCTITGNSYDGWGGGIYNGGTLTVTGTTLSGNSAKFGGGICNFGSASVTNSTLYNNYATSTLHDGGGEILNSSTITITDCTISTTSTSNRASGITNDGTASLEGTIVAVNNDATDIYGSSVNGTYDLVTDGTGGLSNDVEDHNILGSTSVPIAADLAPLTYNLSQQGNTETMALLSDSPAIGAGTVISGVLYDQRDLPRPTGSPNPDIGAYQTLPATLMINGAGDATTNSTYDLTLSAQMPYAQPWQITSWQINWGDGDTQTLTVGSTLNPGFNPAFDIVPHTYSLTSGVVEITATAFVGLGSFSYAAPETLTVAMNFAASGVGTIQPTQSSPYSGTLATFQGNTSGTTSDYSATINWGDNTSSTTGTITYDGNGNYDITGNHTFDLEGTFGVQVQISETDDTVQVNDTAEIAVMPPSTTPTITIPTNLPEFPENPDIPRASLPSGMNYWSPDLSGTAGSTSPIIAASDPTAGPDQTITVTGAQFTADPNSPYDDTQFIVYGQTTSSNAVYTDAQIQDPTTNGALVTLSSSLPNNSMYLVWALNANGASTPIAINNTTPWWVEAPNEPIGDTQNAQTVDADTGQELAIYGENLSNLATSPQSWVYLQTSAYEGAWATNVHVVSPNEVTFDVPDDLEPGTYEVWINNGLGGVYSWAQAPTTVDVASYSSPLTSTVTATIGGTITGSTYTLTGNGSTNDYNALNALLTSMVSGETLILPAGTFLVADGSDQTSQLAIPTDIKDIQIEGAGQGQTTILFTGPVADVGGNQFAFGQLDRGDGNIEIDNLTFEYDGDSAFGSGHALIYFEFSTNVAMNDVTVISNQIDALWPAGSVNFSLTNSTIIGNSSYMSGITDLYMNNDNFFMGYTAEEAAITGQELGFSITNCNIYDYDDSVFNDSTFNIGEKIGNYSGISQGRFLDFGATGDMYAGDNTTVNLEANWPNAGEQLNAEGNPYAYFGSYESSTVEGNGTQEVEINTTNSLPNMVGDCMIVVAGDGLGEMEVVTGVSLSGSTYTFTLSAPWNEPLDSSSQIEIISDNYNNAFYGNSLSDAVGGNGNSGLELYSGGYNIAFTNNTVQNTTTGVAIVAVGNGYQSDYFVQVMNNQIYNTDVGVGIQPTIQGDSSSMLNGVGVLVSDNSAIGVINGLSLISADLSYNQTLLSVFPVTLASFSHNFIAPIIETAPVFAPNYDVVPIQPGGIVIQGNNPDVLFYDNTIIEPNATGDLTPPSGVYYQDYELSDGNWNGTLAISGACHGARQNQPGRGASKPANVLTYSIPHPFYPTQLFLELLVPVHAVWPADTPTSEDNGGSVTVSSGGEHPSSPAVLRRPFGFVFSGVPDWPAVSEVEWPPCRRR